MNGRRFSFFVEVVNPGKLDLPFLLQQLKLILINDLPVIFIGPSTCFYAIVALNPLTNMPPARALFGRNYRPCNGRRGRLRRSKLWML